MSLPRTIRFLPYAAMLFGAACVVSVSASQIDVLLSVDNRASGNEGVVYGRALDDLGFLRKATVDMVGRIPTYADIQQFQQWPPAKRRSMLVDRLMDDKGYADRWTVFFADMLRIRSRAEGGNRLLAHVHKSLETGKPWDTMAKELIAASGSASKTPSVGFLLADDSEPMTMAGATAQIFMGVRLACAQCHNHPFDKWRQKQFYELAGFFGKTKQVENRLSKKTYLTEGDDMKVLWPPERRKPKARFAVEPKFPIPLEEYAVKPDYIKRLEALRVGELSALKKHKESEALDALIDSAGGQDALGAKVEPANLAVTREAKDDIRKLDVQGDLYRRSALRKELGDLITSPKNRYFVRNIINRVWAEMVGRGFYMPIDDYQGEVTHPKTVKYLCDEFIANGYDLRSLFRTILKSEAYARAALGAEIEPEAREGSQAAFASGITRRMVSEVLYDSIVIAGHLQDYKWPKGANVRQFERRVRVPLDPDPAEEAGAETGAATAQTEMKMPAKPKPSPYNLEQVISLDFEELVKSDLVKDLGRMKAMSDQELEAKRMAETAKKKKSLRRRYTYKTVTEEIDDNPRFSSSMRMSTPAAPSHFLRVFGQPSRDGLGEFREHTPSMRQALMMLNGKATHEASRVGPFEPIHSLLTGKRKNLAKAVELAYLEILTRRPSAGEQSEALAVLGQVPMQGMADLRWALLNSHEFRYLP
jgi:hypothetical protein